MRKTWDSFSTKRAKFSAPCATSKKKDIFAVLTSAEGLRASATLAAIAQLSTRAHTPKKGNRLRNLKNAAKTPQGGHELCALEQACLKGCADSLRFFSSFRRMRSKAHRFPCPYSCYFRPHRARDFRQGRASVHSPSATREKRLR